MISRIAADTALSRRENARLYPGSAGTALLTPIRFPVRGPRRADISKGSPSRLPSRFFSARNTVLFTSPLCF